jgi:hypothetical protein
MALDAATASAMLTSGAVSVPNATLCFAAMSNAVMTVGRVGHDAAASSPILLVTQSFNPVATNGAGDAKSAVRPGLRTLGRRP